MKYLLVLLVVMIGVWVWRANRAQERAEERAQARRESLRDRPRDPGAAVDMVACDLCGVHCPRDDLVAGRKGVYCCAQHRNQAEA